MTTTTSPNTPASPRPIREQQPPPDEDSMITNTQNWRRLANTRQWIIDNLSRKVKRLQEENKQLRDQLEHRTATPTHHISTAPERDTP